MTRTISKIIDFHSHILPQVDDGSDSTETSLAMLAKEAGQGVRHVVLTPHFYADRDNPVKFLNRRNEAANRLAEAMWGRDDLPRLHLGAEVAYYKGMSESEDLKKLCLGDSKFIMVELPMRKWGNDIFDELAHIPVRLGLTPVIAHVERYITAFNADKIISRLEELPLRLQVNSSFFLQRKTVKLATRLLRDERIHLIGTDCHNMTSRPPTLGKAVAEIEQRLGDDALDWICWNQRLIFPDL
ncbi:MAG: hypothetical protein E7430_07890 [Ruminococcaceae bacterium]|nr:hypothetical protein [Oscillospiraceae bacterium]